MNFHEKHDDHDTVQEKYIVGIFYWKMEEGWKWKPIGDRVSIRQ